MAKTLEIKGTNDKDETLRLEAYKKLDDLNTAELQRLVELKENPKARGFLKTSFSFGILKGYLATK